MNISKYISISLFSAACFVLSVAPAFADTSCQPTYGGVYGGSNCKPSSHITIDKKVQNPQSGVFVDNLGVNDPTFGPDSIVTFQIKVTNTGNTTLDTVTIKDFFPQYIKFSGGAGSYDTERNTLTLTMNGLQPGDSRSVTVGGRVADAKDLPSDKMTTCVVNKAEAKANDMTVSDTANLCIEKQAHVTKGGLTVAPAPKVTKTPATGAESLILFGLAPLGSLGYLLRKKTNTV
jgi:uncharacterized repeat protein (TIGR01451 family)